jgi:lauroyl/myristoyl acyltransferase
MRPNHSGKELQSFRRKVAPASRRFISRDDILFFLEWPLLKLSVFALPETRWSRLDETLELIKLRLGLTNNATRIAKIQKALNFPTIFEAQRIALRCAANRIEHFIQAIKANTQAGWNPRIDLQGDELIRSALYKNNGVILWVGHFCSSPLITKIALKDAGYDIFHLSRLEHGISSSMFGMRYLNPIRVRAESPFLKGRILINNSNPASALRRAMRILNDNGIVSITAGGWSGSALVKGPLLGGRIVLATGAPALAHQTGATLLPVLSFRLADGGGHLVQICRPLLGMGLADRSAAVRAAIKDFLGVLEDGVTAFPDQWRGWKDLEFECP